MQISLPSLFKLTLAVASVFLPAATHAEVKLPGMFSDHMVLQRESAVAIWGTATADEEVTVKFREQVKKATANADGKWRVTLAPLTAGGPDVLMVSGKNALKFQNVLVGEVWVGSGQSNMQGSTSGYAKNDSVLAKLAASAPYAKLRLIKGNGGWSEATPQNINGFSALLFTFGLKLQQELDVPVGLMQGAVGGTPSGAWLSEAALAADEKSQELIRKSAEAYPQAVKNYEENTLPAWEKAVVAAKNGGKPEPKKPAPPAKPGTVNGRPVGYLFEEHLRHFVGYGIRGALWDQGEGGTAISGVDQYTLMGALISGWRKEWGVGEFPFIYVQKPSGGGCPWDKENPTTAQGEAFKPLPAVVPSDGTYVETHVKIMTYPNTAMAISSDLGPGIHPSNKSGYGHRAAAVALGMTYKKPVEYYGPLYASHAVEGDKVRVHFTHVGKGLAVRHAERLQGFAVAGEDKKFFWATATLDGESVVLHCPEVSKPVAVRYAFASQRQWANLFNLNGLPAVPFRTDSW